MRTCRNASFSGLWFPELMELCGNMIWFVSSFRLVGQFFVYDQSSRTTFCCNFADEMRFQTDLWFLQFKSNLSSFIAFNTLFGLYKALHRNFSWVQTTRNTLSVEISANMAFSEGILVLYNIRLMVNCFPICFDVTDTCTSCAYLFRWGRRCRITFLRWLKKHGIFRQTSGSPYKSRNVQLFPNRFWAFAKLSNSFVQFGWLKPQFVREFGRKRHF